MAQQRFTITWEQQQQLTHPPVLDNHWHLLRTVSELGSVLPYSAVICVFPHPPPIEGALSTRDFTSILKIIAFFFVLFSAIQSLYRVRRCHLAVSMHPNGECECAD